MKLAALTSEAPAVRKALGKLGDVAALTGGILLRGEFGSSLRDHLPIRQAIASHIAPTLELAVLGMVIAVMVALPVGILSALKPGSLGDMVATVLALSGVAVPHFFLGILLIYAFAVWLRILPPSGYVAPWENLGENLRQWHQARDFAPRGVEHERERRGIGNPARHDLIGRLALFEDEAVVEPEAGADGNLPIVGAAMAVDRAATHRHQQFFNDRQDAGRGQTCDAAT